MNRLQRVFQVVALNSGFFADFETALHAAELAFSVAGYNEPGFAHMALTKNHLAIGELMPRTAWAAENENRNELDGWDLASGASITAPFIVTAGGEVGLNQ